MSIDISKPVQTRRGRPVEIIRVLDAPLSGTDDRIIALVRDDDGGTDLCSYRIDGRFSPTNESGLDLVNSPSRSRSSAEQSK